ncbi:MAG TPA: FAD-dependent oxidoreductase [Steroidobacteraceae bacterium]|nr:FAD-dependent oxidoreductase [Steroidobacteraceae bacterium]
MDRNVAALTAAEFDVLVIGGGAFGAAAAREAALRGLNTALIERADFGAGASAECFKMVHGGIRYLQHLDFPRLRASAHERSAFLRIAPHLVNPLPIAIPTFGYGRKGKAFLGAGARVYDLCTIDRNRGISDPRRQIHRSQRLSRADVLSLFPHLDSPDLTGAVVFEDGQMYNPARLVLAFVRAAVDLGATAANYVGAERFLWEGSTVRGVKARDAITGDTFDIRARVTLNAAGPWADYLLKDPEHFPAHRRLPFSRDAYFVVDRKPTSEFAVAVQALSRDKDAVFARATRHLFAVPWHDKTLIGVWHRLWPDAPDTAHVTEEEIETWIHELNTVYPTLHLKHSEVCFAHCGLVPFGETATETELSFGKKSRITDHRAHGIHGLVSLAGIRYTTARIDGTEALELLLQQFKGAYRQIDSSLSTRMHLPGGDIENFSEFERRAQRHSSRFVSASALRSLLRNHGTRYAEVLACTHGNTALVPQSDTLVAEVRHAVEQEMALRLEDVVLRRTDLGAARHPGDAAVEFVAAQMGKILAWSPQRVSDEIQRTRSVLDLHRAKVTTYSDREPTTLPNTSVSTGPTLATVPA